MTTIVHISDLHFGKIANKILPSLIQSINKLNPSIIVVSGDLTQRATKTEFQEARIFFDQLTSPKLIVPGNHDIPLYNIFKRISNPFSRYKKYIHHDLQPSFQNDDVMIFGINTARASKIMNGKFSNNQVEKILQKMKTLDPTVFKIVVTHHPLDLPETYSKDRLVKNWRNVLTKLIDKKTDIFLSGHFHRSGVIPTAHRLKRDGYASLALQSGTTTSTRTRGEKNSFNVIKFENPKLTIENYLWDEEFQQFVKVKSQKFLRHTQKGWSPRKV